MFFFEYPFLYLLLLSCRYVCQPFTWNQNCKDLSSTCFLLLSFTYGNSVIWKYWYLLHGSEKLRNLSKDRKQMVSGFPDGPVVKNPPADAGDEGLIPGQGGFHMPWGSWAQEPQLLSPSPHESVLHSQRSNCNEKSGPCSPKLEKALK